MCRLFAWHSPNSLSVSEALDSDFPVFTKLSELHRDGWGMAYEHDENIELVRDTNAAYDSELYLKSANEIRTKNAISHLRWATEELSVCIPNTHPFIKQGPNGTIAFCHNGGIARTPALSALIDSDLCAGLEGDTDSEQYFAVLLTQVRKNNGDFVSAYRNLVADLDAIHYTSINALILTNQELIIVCQHKPENRSPDLNADYYDVYWQAVGGITSAWSSGVRPNAINFNELKNGSMLVIDTVTGEVSTHDLR